MQEVKKSTKMYSDFAHSKQTFDQVRLFEVFNGDVILRGQRGQRDHVYPLAKACKRFWRMYDMYRWWMLHGFKTQCEELKLILADLGHKIQEAIAQRQAGLSTEPPPAFCNAHYMGMLAEALKAL